MIQMDEFITKKLWLDNTGKLVLLQPLFYIRITCILYM